MIPNNECRKNRISIEGDTASIQLPCGLVAIVDSVDLPLVSSYRWTAKRDARTAYAVRKTNERYQDGSKKVTLMHRDIAGHPSGMEVDHIDGNGLNNRRCNLRVATHAENTRNARVRADSKSGVKGVFWNKSRNAWRAQITVDGKQMHLGHFKTIEEAIARRQAAAEELHGAFARHA